MVYQYDKVVALSKSLDSNVNDSGVHLESISIVTPPNKVLYTVGEIFDPTGMEVIGNLSNGKSVYIKLPDLTFNPSGPLLDGTEAVQVVLDWGSLILSAVQDITVSLALEWWSPKMTSDTKPEPYVASATNFYSSSFAPWKAFDNNKSTCWAETYPGFENCIMFDFGFQTLIYGFSITPAPAQHAVGFPVQFDFQGSNDNTEWVAILHGDVSGIPTEPVSFTFRKGESYRYYRLTHMTYETENMMCRIGELMFLMPIADEATIELPQSAQFELELPQEFTAVTAVTATYVDTNLTIDDKDET